MPAPNRLESGMIAGRPGEVLISDITYVATGQGWLYLAVTLDLFSRQVSGWHLAENMETSSEFALTQTRPDRRRDKESYQSLIEISVSHISGLSINELISGIMRFHWM